MNLNSKAGRLITATFLASALSTPAQQTALPTLSASVTDRGSIRLNWPAAAAGFELEETVALGRANAWAAVAASPQIQDGQFTVTLVPSSAPRFYRLSQTVVNVTFQITAHTPLDGANEVGVTVRPQVFFSEPINVTTLSSLNFFAEAAGVPLAAGVVPSNDGTFAWLFFRNPMPGGTRVRVTVDGSSITSAQDGKSLDADGDGLPGGLRQFEFTTVNLQGMAGTSLSGVVADPGPDLIPRTDDDLQAGPDGQLGTGDDVFLLPIAGVQVHLLGREDQVFTTQTDGKFHFDSVPVGDVKIVIDGTTTTQPPAGFYFPEMVVDAQMALGQENWSMANGPEVYLPRISKSILQTVNAGSTNQILATPDGAPGLSAFQRSQLSIEIAPNSLIGPTGQPLSAGQIGISTVPADIVRDMLPPGVLQHTFDITVQAPGIATFSTPAPMSFPNVFNAAPGTQLNFLSFDHTTGRLVIEGTATVSADGSSVQTDPGTGITHPGWHGLTPPGGPNDPPCNPTLPHTVDVAPIPVISGLANSLFFEDGESIVLSFGNAAQRVEPKYDVCDPLNASATPLIIQIETDGPVGRFLSGLPTGPISLLPGETRDIRVTALPLTTQAAYGQRADQIYGALIRIKGYQYGNSPQVALVDKTIALGRFVSVVNPDVPNTVRFLKTLSDGPGQFVRTKNVQVDLPIHETTVFAGTGPGAAQFKLDATAIQRDIVHLQFDPTDEGEVRAGMTVKLGEYLLNPALEVRGTGEKPTTISVGRAQFQQLLKAYLQEPKHFNGSPGVSQASADFKAVAHQEGILPSDNPTAAFLDSKITVIGGKLVDAVRADYDPANILGQGFVVVDDGGNITTTWVAAALLTTQVGAVFGYADGDRDVEHLRTMLTKRNRGIAYFAYAFCEFLNLHPANNATFGFDIEPHYYGRYTAFTKFVANTVSHELGHTFGLLDSYVNVTNAVGKITGGKPINPPGDIMRSGDGNDPDLYFGPENLMTLRAAIGLAPNEAEDNQLDFAIALYRLNFNLATSRAGIGIGPRDISTEPFPHLDLPGISRTPDSGYFLDTGTILVDGQGHQLTNLVLTVVNDGTLPLALNNIQFANGHQGFSESDTNLAGSTIDVGETVSLTVTFDPTRSGPASDHLLIQTDQPEATYSIQVSGDGLSSLGKIGLVLSPDPSSGAPQNNVGGAPIDAVAKQIPNYATIRNIGGGPLTVREVSSRDSRFTISGLPATFPGQPLVIPPGQTQTFALAFTPDQLGLIRGRIEVVSDDPDSPTARLSVIGTGLPASGNALEALDYGKDYVAMESPDFPDGPVLRTRTDDQGNFEFFLPPNQRYHAVIFDPVSGLVAHLFGITAASGQKTHLGAPEFQASTVIDSDGDGLPDDVEFAIGTDPHKADTDGDGVDDFVAVLQGVDPLGGKAALTGVIAQVPIVDQAQDVVVLPNRRGDARLAYVAAYGGGLVIVDVTRPSTPSVVGRLALRGQSLFVSVDPVWQVAAVTGDSSIYLVDVSNPGSPQLIQSYPCAAPSQAVEVDGYAYFEANYGTLYALNTRSGTIEQQMDLPGNYISSVVREGDFLYIMDSNSLLRIVQINGAQMTLRGSMQLSAGSGRFVVANGIAYIPSSGRFDPQTGVTVAGGYATYDVSDSDKPVLITNSSVPAGTAEPGGALAVSGSGFGVLVGNAPGFGNVADLLNVSDPKNTYAFLTRFTLPEKPLAVAITSGTAFIADGAAGLVVLNYQAFDTAGLAPTPTIGGIFAESDPSQPSTELVEGSRFRVQATVADDAQISKIEMLVNGQVIQSSSSVPFNLVGFAPNISGASNTFIVQVRATDSGGNVGLSQPTVIHLLRDTTPPVLLKSNPAEGDQKFRGMTSVILSFSEALANASLVAANFEIIHESGVVTRPTAFTLRSLNQEVELAIPPLDVPGNYRLIVHAATVTDGAGNPLGRADVTRAFSVLPYSIRWNRAETANWFTATNWIPQRTPIPTDWVYIGTVPTNAAVHLTSHNPAVPDLEKVRVRSLVSEADLVLLYCELHVDEPFLCDRSLYLTASKLTDTVLVAGPKTVLGYNLGPTSPFVTREGYFSALDGVTLQGNVEMKTECHILNSFTLEGNVYGKVDRQSSFNGVLHATRDTIIQGPGTFHDLPFEVSSGELNAPNRSGPLVTISSDVTFRGALNIALEGSSSRLINRGQLLADDPLPFASGRYYSAINMVGGIGTNEFLINEGTIQVSNGYRLLIGGPFNTQIINRGVIQAETNSFLWFAVPLISPKVRCEAGAVVQLSGRNAPWTTDAGQVSELSGPGLWLAGETEFRGGTIRLTDGAILEGTAVFNGVTFEGELHNYDWNSRQAALPSFLTGYGNQVQVLTNMTLNGLIAFHRPDATAGGGRLFLLGAQSRLDGQGHIEFEGPSRSNQVLGGGFADASGFLTIGPNITIHGQSLTIGKVPGVDSGQLPLVENQGTILTQPGDFLSFGTYGFTNSGTIHIAGTNRITVQFNFDQTAAGRLEFEASASPTGPASGQLNVGGAANLGGALKLGLIAPFTPAAGDGFDLLVYRSWFGRFASIQTPPTPLTLEYSPDYGPTTFRLQLLKP